MQVFHVNYLGGDQASFTLNFSKGSGTIVGQYYNFIRFGRTGYIQIIANCMANAQHLREKLAATGKVRVVCLSVRTRGMTSVYKQCIGAET